MKPTPARIITRSTRAKSALARSARPRQPCWQSMVLGPERRAERSRPVQRLRPNARGCEGRICCVLGAWLEAAGLTEDTPTAQLKAPGTATFGITIRSGLRLFSNCGIFDCLLAVATLTRGLGDPARLWVGLGEQGEGCVPGAVFATAICTVRTRLIGAAFDEPLH